MSNKLYVYEWFIVDTLEVFYVGKGTGNRRFETHNRNRYFKSIYNKYKCAVRVVYQYLSNEEACSLEIERIVEMKSMGKARCNFTYGGTGFSTGDMNPNRINPPTGKKNGMYGVQLFGESNGFYGKTHSEETKFKISNSRKGKGARFGDDNPMYGKGFKGKDNPMFGRTGFDHPNSKMYKATYQDNEIEYLTFKQCEKKFGIAFMRVQDGGLIHYKKKSKNDIYEGTLIERVNKLHEGVTTIESTSD
ncbi:NUMOD3 domain-containing DNA-binding protein [Lysinibacillus sp. Bpr_S20]|uniref:NUMOD3 domain-containing DNA-binding protein n=1 Tax=Lysinibacillus sp. Bpr_S20 TaxID=2933964 RepID=UPI002012F88F|nr:NUMOD3 domain-containing DNA-binding protein [Lysinibacillus sp. Bpr_S20]MCL1700700.1 NUMOD3 domain-containing DNA-binding protein [Lysinibacillus sp. Bpr_S20]